MNDKRVCHGATPRNDDPHRPLGQVAKRLENKKHNGEPECREQFRDRDTRLRYRSLRFYRDKLLKKPTSAARSGCNALSSAYAPLPNSESTAPSILAASSRSGLVAI